MKTDYLELLKKHQPILRLSKGERFKPIPVEEYVKMSKMHYPINSGHEGGILEKNITIDNLNDQQVPGTFLKFVSLSEQRRVLANPVKFSKIPNTTHRLAYVGLSGRLVDAGMKATNIFRPTVPKSVSNAAAVKAAKIQKNNAPTCYGRVVEDGPWVCLQYFYLYAMNDWRSRFRGVNDHEADWEQVIIYLDAKSKKPQWVAYAMHDEYGDQLRRHWSDPEVKKESDRPVVFAGAGSHASYFSQGEYVTSVHVRLLSALVSVQRLFRRLARMPTDVNGIDIPYIDIANGTGPTLEDISVIQISEETPWVQYPGLWGLDTDDPADGERAPAGPKFQRNGSIRKSWTDPVGWAGLHKVIPDSQLDDSASLEHYRTHLSREIEDLRATTHALSLVSGAKAEKEIKLREAQLTELKSIEAILNNEKQRESKDIRSHLKHPVKPIEHSSQSRTRLLNIWALISAPAVLFVAAISLWTPAERSWAFLVTGMGIIFILELFTKRKILRYLIVYSIIFGAFVVALVILNFSLKRVDEAVALLLAAIGLMVFAGNVRDKLTTFRK